jgi:TonB-dependent receptor
VQTTLSLIVACLAIFFAPTAAAATGTVEGTITSAASGRSLNNAEVSLENSSLRTMSDSGGRFWLTGVPAGRVTLAVKYVGLATSTVVVDVPSGGTLMTTVELQPLDGVRPTSKSGEVVTLEAFAVVAEREMSAQALAMNERRYARNTKNVVAFDEYGDRSTENIGDFMRFLSGVAVDDARGSGEAEGVMLRGFAGNATGIMLDGAELAGGDTTTRLISLKSVPMANVSRVEVTKMPTPDMPASGLGGSINLISRSGFEVRKPKLNYQAYAILSARHGITVDAGPKNAMPSTSPSTIEPSFNFSYLHPVNGKLAITLGGARTWRYTPLERDGESNEGVAWDLVVASPVQTVSHLLTSARLAKTEDGRIGAEWRLSSRDTLSASVQQRRSDDRVNDNANFRVAFGTGAVGNAQFTQGASTGVGSVTQASQGISIREMKNTILTIKYDHRGDVWQFAAGGSWSQAVSDLSDISRGEFATAPTTLANLIIRGDGIPASPDDGVMPRRFRATDRAGNVVDLYDGGKYSLLTATSAEGESTTERSQGRVDLARTAGGVGSLKLKTGLSIDRSFRDQRRYNKTWTFTPNGRTDVTSKLASNFDLFDDSFNAVGPTIFGQPMRWVSSRKAYALYQQHPDWFVLNQTGEHSSLVQNSRRFIETISAAYLRSDLRFFDSRLWTVAGVRFEKTDSHGWGPLDDISAQFQTDAAGRFLLNAAGQRIPISADPLVLAKARYQERAAFGRRDYSGYYPSLNLTYNLSEKLLLRGGYARTIGRPNVNFIVPGVTITDPNAANPTITVINTGLKPWTADSVDLSLESYHLKDGFGSIGVFQKSVADFFGSSVVRATPALLELYGFTPDETLLNYDIRTTYNAGDAEIRGLEFNYRQSLAFLPRWARGVQVFVNGTWLRVGGPDAAVFVGFAPSNFSGGINFIRSRYFIKLNWTYQGLTRRSVLPASAIIPAGAYRYQIPTTRWGLSAQYSFSRRISLYGTVQDIGGFTAGERQYAPGTPEYAKTTRYVTIPATYTLGIKGEF